MRSHSRATDSLAGALLALMFVLAGGAALNESVTVDEVAHIGAGLSYIQKLDLRMNPEHPPLPKLLAGIPLALRGTYADYSNVSWTFSAEFFPAYMGQWVFGEWVLNRWNDPVRTLAWARLPMLLVALLLGWLLYVYGARLGGSWGGLLALSLYVSAPVFLAFGPLVLTDITVTLFTLAALWTFADVWAEPNRRNIVLFALALAGAFLSKFSAPFLIVALFVIAVTTRWWPVAGQPRERAEARSWRRTRWRAALKSTALAGAVVYAVYLVFSWNQPLDVLTRLGTGPVATVFERLLMPPWLYLRGFAFVMIGSSRPTFLFGHVYSHGIPLFFPVVFALKSPPASLVLLALTAIFAFVVRRSGPRGRRIVPDALRPHWRVLWVALVVFTAICLVSRMTISLRHFTIPMALMILATSLLPRALTLLPLRTKIAAHGLAVAVVVLAATSVITAVRTYPYYFPYVNALSLGAPAYRLFSDSNVDWNHALPEAARFADTLGVGELKLDMYGFSDPTFVIRQARVWDCQVPEARDAGRWVIVSANLLLDTHNCEWLTRYPMRELAGGSMYAVQLPSPIPTEGVTGGPPTAANRRVLWGMPLDIRTVFLRVSRDPRQLPAAYEDVKQRFMAQQQAQPR